MFEAMPPGTLIFSQAVGAGEIRGCPDHSRDQRIRLIDGIQFRLRRDGILRFKKMDEFKPEPGFTLLFNGKNLDGWQTKAAKPESLEGKAGAFDGRFQVKDGELVIDYKTSRNLTPKQWEPPRPDDPQLALYAVSAKEEVTAVVFAKVRPGEMRMMGYSRDEKALPRVQKAKAWQPLLREWKNEAESLGSAFARGEASVDPKKDLMTCRYCGLETLCRIYEKINVLAEEEIEEW